MPRPVTGRRRGGQPGNTNRLVHGRYSRRLPRSLMPDLSPRTTLDGGFEIALARVRLVQLMNAQDSASQAQWLSYERAILGYLGRIASMIDAGIRRRQLQLDLFRLLEGSPVVSAPSSDCATGDSNLVRTSTVDHGASRV